MEFLDNCCFVIFHLGMIFKYFFHFFDEGQSGGQDFEDMDISDVEDDGDLYD